MARKSPDPVPEGMHNATIHLWFNGNCREAVDFYQKALGAKLAGPVIDGPGGNGVIHAMIKIGDSNIMMADAWPDSPEKGPEDFATASIYLYVDDCDAVYNQALEAGCEVIHEMMNTFWGDRSGKVKDPFGHCWSISTYKEILSPEELKERQEEWMKSLG